MKIFKRGKDGGEESHVHGYWLIEIKSLFSIAVLRFENGSREVYHNHAFDCISWVLNGGLVECHKNGRIQLHSPSLFPIITRRDTYHKVYSTGRTWVFTIRGPWTKEWNETIGDKEITLTNGRKVVDNS
jgi:hypothetical protein